MPLNVDYIRHRLPGRQIVYFDTIPSTMPEAARLAAAGAPSGTLVIADEQTAGQGRQGRHWYSEKESGLYLSLILRLEVDSDLLPFVTLATGLAAQEAIRLVSGITCQIRWPNDLLAQGRKCGGILCQKIDDAVIAGIGINVNHESFPGDLAEIATSLRMLTGQIHSREDLLIELVRHVDAYCELLSREGSASILSLYAVRARRS